MPVVGKSVCSTVTCYFLCCIILIKKAQWLVSFIAPSTTVKEATFTRSGQLHSLGQKGVN